MLNLVKKEDFGYRQIRDIKVSDAQQWIMKLHNDGKGYSTITRSGELSSQPFKWRTTRTLSVEIPLTSNWQMLYPMIHGSGLP